MTADWRSDWAAETAVSLFGTDMVCLLEFPDDILFLPVVEFCIGGQAETWQYVPVNVPADFQVGDVRLE